MNISVISTPHIHPSQSHSLPSPATHNVTDYVIKATHTESQPCRPTASKPWTARCNVELYDGRSRAHSYSSACKCRLDKPAMITDEWTSSKQRYSPASLRYFEDVGCVTVKTSDLPLTDPRDADATYSVSHHMVIKLFLLLDLVAEYRSRQWV